MDVGCDAACKAKSNFNNKKLFLSKKSFPNLTSLLSMSKVWPKKTFLKIFNGLKHGKWAIATILFLR